MRVRAADSAHDCSLTRSPVRGSRPRSNERERGGRVGDGERDSASGVPAHAADGTNGSLAADNDVGVRVL